ncbi:MAG: hypothetical protein A2X94_06555 [Bdellovibrionales bacterium GWB1_55_8]|nr:MAG: hypothetical protein A2X94_06555 [Bdellovibrionales bacterium GWB1_55_8]
MFPSTYVASFEAVLFDLDGTLIDTEPSAARAVKSCFENWGIKVSLEDAAFVTGRTWEAALSYLFSKYTPPVSIAAATSMILDQYRQTLKTELIVVPGGVEAVHSIGEAYPLALVSGSHRSEIEWALGKLGILSRFSAVLGAEDYPSSKPAPDGYLKACSLLGVDPKRCLIFEDSDAGIASALNAGGWVVAITGTNHFRQNTSGAHLQIPDLSHVTRQWVADLAVRAHGTRIAREQK